MALSSRNRPQWAGSGKDGGVGGQIGPSGGKEKKQLVLGAVRADAYTLWGREEDDVQDGVVEAGGDEYGMGGTVRALGLCS